VLEMSCRARSQEHELDFVTNRARSGAHGSLEKKATRTRFIMAATI